MPQITVMTGHKRRRRWIDEERLRILEAALSPGAVVADVARPCRGEFVEAPAHMAPSEGELDVAPLR